MNDAKYPQPFNSGSAPPELLARPARDPALRLAVKAAIAQYDAGDLPAAYRAALPLAERGHPEAQKLVGNALAQGALGHPDLSGAQHWWEQAAQSGDKVAQRNLGQSHLDPNAGPRDPERAQMWLTEAALGGDREAMGMLGELLLTEAGDNGPRAAEGYYWLQMACLRNDLGARMALGRALKSSVGDDSARLAALQVEALRCSAPYRGTTGSDLLQQADRGPALSYFLTGVLLHTAGMQGFSLNAFSENPTQPSPRTLGETSMRASELLVRKWVGLVPPDATHWTLFRRGLRQDGIRAVPVPAARLWELVRPGDQVELSDGINAHVTFAWSIDRDQGVIRFIDAWPDEFLLLPGLNALGVEAKTERCGRTRTLLCVGRDDFVMAVRGLSSVVGIASIQALWNGLPELRADPAAALALATTLAEEWNPEASARGLGWLLALLRGENPGLRADQIGAAADRAWIAAERLRSDDATRLIYCATMGISKNAEELGAILDELAQRWPPRFDTLGPRTLAEVVMRRKSSGTQDRPWPDALLRSDVVGAEALVRFGLERYPNSERLRLFHSELLLTLGRNETAARDLSAVIEALEAKLHQWPLGRDIDGVEGPREREEIREAQVFALMLRAKALSALDQSSEAVDALQRALAIAGSEDPALLTQLARAAAAAGDSALTAATQIRLNEATAAQSFQRILNSI